MPKLSLSAALLLCIFASAYAAPAGSERHKAAKDGSPDAAHRAVVQPSLAPTAIIRVEPMGFAPPSLHYITARISQVSLDFLDENHLLFTFRVPGLIAREHKPDDDHDGMERHIRAMVIELPSGTVTAEALWTLHDFDRYLWTLSGGRFLLRDENILQVGDASLRLTPYLRFPGPLDSLDMDPERQLLVTQTTEKSAPDPASNSSTASAAVTSDEANDGGHPVEHKPGDSAANHASGHTGDSDQQTQRILRVMGLDSRSVMLFSRISGLVHLPIDGEGYYEALRGSGAFWLISYRNFRGSDQPLLKIESSCTPSLDVVAPGVVLASICMGSANARKLVAVTRDKRMLWEAPVSPVTAWPVLARQPEARRIARSALDVINPVGINSPLGPEDLRGQTVRVYDLATGKIALTAPVSPPLDAGGNFALSPSGSRVATLCDGAIQVFDLPPAPVIPPPSVKQAEAARPGSAPSPNP